MGFKLFICIKIPPIFRSLRLKKRKKAKKKTSPTEHKRKYRMHLRLPLLLFASAISSSFALENSSLTFAVRVISPPNAPQCTMPSNITSDPTDSFPSNSSALVYFRISMIHDNVSTELRAYDIIGGRRGITVEVVSTTNSDINPVSMVPPTTLSKTSHQITRKQNMSKQLGVGADATFIYELRLQSGTKRLSQLSLGFSFKVKLSSCVQSVSRSVSACLGGDEVHQVDIKDIKAYLYRFADNGNASTFIAVPATC